MKNKYNILVIEDEAAIRNFITSVLMADGYLVNHAATGQQAIFMIRTSQPDIILLDLGLPDMDGMDILRQVRRNSTIPVIVVSARDQEKEKVISLDIGADDYIVKPFGADELLARIRTAIRHNTKLQTGEPAGAFKCDDLTVDFDRRIVTLEGKDIHLTQVEYRILTLLCRQSGHVLTHDYIIKNVWGPYAPYDIQILRVNMANIRRKIEKNPAEPQYVLTEVGVGYRMTEGTTNN